MAVWIEIHCDTPAEDVPDSIWRKAPPYGMMSCATQDAENSGLLFRTGQRPDWMMKRSAEEARARGYKRTRKYGWQCPFCVKHRTKFTTTE
ncbi:hypothetical protein KEU06_08965 [Pseudaminobacter sp. 19-2017]|uniref:Uncharacterized protein n=1 Tax=Pseudaminobacter soli (ex Zhang et al. 2022) TaxID=2831468 RepID=A0A942E080_9HYPH|nr:hypothetical protein [Pseudaminobacter soli]MBS3648758.1 hypothetical protein [Pseudaminobacter soli]